MAETARPKGKLAGTGIRLIAGGYDACILVGLAFLAFIPVTVAEQQLGAIPHSFKVMLLISVAFAYFVGFWHKAGATTGMRPWKLRVAVCDTGEPVTLLAASIRFIVLMLTWLAALMTFVYMLYRDTGHALFFVCALIPVISMACMMLTPNRQTLHDLIAGTSIYRIED